MIKETVKYKDFNGNEVSTDLYFNLSKMEIVEIGVNEFAERLQTIINSSNGPEVLKEFKKFIADAYGIKSDDGKRFVKNDEVRANFIDSAAYDEFMFKLMTDAAFASKFVNNLIPKETMEEIKAGIDKINADDVSNQL